MIFHSAIFRYAHSLKLCNNFYPSLSQESAFDGSFQVWLTGHSSRYPRHLIPENLGPGGAHAMLIGH